MNIKHYDNEELEENGKKVNLTYSMSFGKGDGGDECDWEAHMTYKEYNTYLQYMKSKGKEEYSFDDMESALPEWASHIYDEICETETSTYRENADPDDDDYDEIMDDDWNISEIANLYVRFVSFEDKD